MRVAGHSMEPALHHGDGLVYLRLPLRAGDVVVAEDPRDTGVEGGGAPCRERDTRLLVKRVAGIDKDDVILASDNPGHESLMVERDAILGRVVLRY